MTLDQVLILSRTGLTAAAPALVLLAGLRRAARPARLVLASPGPPPARMAFAIRPRP
jgi:hypothetical protein